jgi:hypothetical protein
VVANEAAEQLREWTTGPLMEAGGDQMLPKHDELLNEALAEERRATVERIRADALSANIGDYAKSLIERFLDAEAQR